MSLVICCLGSAIIGNPKKTHVHPQIIISQRFQLIRLAVSEEIANKQTDKHTDTLTDTEEGVDK